MRKAIMILFSVLFPLFAGTAFAYHVSLPRVFNGIALTEDGIRTKPAPPDGSTTVIAIGVRVTEGTSPFVFFEEALWRKQFDVSTLMSERPPTAVQEYVSLFCAMNQGVAAQACAQGAELKNVSTNDVWWIPLATVPTSELGAVKAQLMLPGEARSVVNSAPPVSSPSVQAPVQQRHVPPTPPASMQQQAPTHRPIIWDDAPAQKAAMGIIWDD